MAESDFITIHMPKTPETVGMIGAEQPSRRRSRTLRTSSTPPAAALVDEDALYDALKDRPASPAPASTSSPRSPCTDQPALRAGQRRRRRPHLGASTDEAQEKAGIAVAKSVRLALAGELVPDAVNVARAA